MGTDTRAVTRRTRLRNAHHCTSSRSVAPPRFPAAAQRSEPLSFYKGKQILSATFSARVQHVYWADARAEPVQLYRVAGANGYLNPDSNWGNNSGNWSMHLETVNEKIQPTSCTSQANLHFKSGADGGLTNNVRTAANEGWDSMVLGLKAQDEGSFGGWKRVCGNSYLSISYNSLPGQIQTSQMTSDPGGACTTGTGRPYSDRRARSRRSTPPTTRRVRRRTSC